MKLQNKFNVEYNFPVFFKENIFSENQNFWQEIFGKKKHRFLIFIDKDVLKNFPELTLNISIWSKKYAEFLSFVEIEGGEKCKEKINNVLDCSEKIIQAKLCRHSFVLIIGGGSVLDMVGFACAITHRGIRHIRIPTTILAQDDSAMGVKNGINHFGLKNLLGSFYPPSAVVCDAEFLKKLPRKDFISGMSEAFKVAIIKDKAFLDFLLKNTKKIILRDEKTIAKIVQKSAKIHYHHITKNGDPFETGSSRPLDFGHWSAHKLEKMSKGKVSHGEAVAIGISLDLIYAKNSGLLKLEEIEKVLIAMKEIGLPIWHKLLKRKTKGEIEIFCGLEEFREHIGGEICLTMPNTLGNLIEINKIDKKLLQTSLNELKKIDKNKGKKNELFS